MFSPQYAFNSSFDISVLDTNRLRNRSITFIKSDNIIGTYIRNGTYWEDWMLKYIQENYKPNTNMIDLGGNIGTTSLLMEEVLSEGNTIFTFEPIYSDILLKNIVDNNLCEKIILYPYGAGNKIESVKIRNIDLTSSTNFGGTSIVDTLEDNYNSLKVNLIPVDVLNFDNVSLIKIDVENMEIEVLEGCINLIKQCKPTILIETYKFNDLVKTDIFKQLTELGYNINPIPEGYCDFIMKIK